MYLMGQALVGVMPWIMPESLQADFQVFLTLRKTEGTQGRHTRKPMRAAIGGSEIDESEDLTL